MAVLRAAQRIPAVRKMHSAQPFKADHAVKLREHTVEIIYDIVSGIEDMADIHAHAHLVAKLHPVKDFPQLFKPAADLAALARHRLQQNGCGLLLPKDRIERIPY